jgi:hypothetical protein
MKFPVAYYLLLLYLTVMLRPLMPIICDAWDHTFAESIHIATVHAKYGANHLQSVLADHAAENNTNGKTQNTVKSSEVVPAHFMEDEQDCMLTSNNIRKIYNPLPINKCVSVFLSMQVPPPKFFC